MRRLVLMMFTLAFVNGLIFAQKSDIILSGSQVRSRDSNVKLIANPAYLTGTYVIKFVSGGNKGFWIENGQGQIIASFKDSRKAIGYQLTQGKYKVIPNLPPGQSSATVRVFLHRKAVRKK